MDYPKRKSPRIPYFDYALPYYYFVTICTHEKQIIFGKPGRLNDFGNIAEQYLQEIPVKYPEVILDKYVVMPNHVHAILILTQNQNENHSISRIVGQYKMSVTKKIRETKSDIQVWQRSYHDHIIRNQKGYENIWIYIENNPIQWEEDCFYPADSRI